MRILVTGGAGFIGSRFVRAIRMTPGLEAIVVYDALTYAACDRFGDCSDVTLIQANVRDPRKLATVIRHFQITHVVHFAAETHVDNSILDPERFVRTNILGTHNLLEAVRERGRQVQRMVYVSTDEVYGSVLKGEASEDWTLAPSSPYSASKAAGEMLCRGAWVTYGTPVVITRGCNTFGPRQNKEKFIPKCVHSIMHGKSIPIYGDGGQRREWIHVDDHVMGILVALQRGMFGMAYNIGSGVRMTNLALADEIIRIVRDEGGPPGFCESVADRPGHDLRYAIDSTLLKQLRWECGPFDLKRVVKELLDEF